MAAKRSASPTSSADFHGSGHQPSSTERAFLVGIEYKSRKTQAARQARAAALSAQKERCPSTELPDQEAPFSGEDSMSELRELVSSAGAEIAGEAVQSKDRPDPATLVGRGKLEEISASAHGAGAQVLIFDHELSPSQQRNIEAETHLRVLDRTQLILDIFARHARSREGQLQVELAQLEYLLPRLTGRGIEMSQLGGGIGTRGPGETQLETDRRKIFRRLRHLKEQIESVRRTRSEQRRRRESLPIATVALVGYTNAGKSTLFNALTKAGVQESARMFATLDPTIRSIALPSKRKILLSDTVGFIRNLPHTLVSAFRATLEEVERAGLLLHVCDVTNPHGREQEAQVEKVLEELGAHKQERIRVLNKIDLLPPLVRDNLRDGTKTVHVSSKTGAGLASLLDAIDGAVHDDPLARVHLLIPQKEGKALALVESSGRVFSRSYRGGSVVLEAQIAESVLRKLKKFVVSEV